MNDRVKEKYMTWMIFAINVIAYLIYIIVGESVYDWGSLSVRDIIENQEYYRILSSSFLHSGVDHIVGNMVFMVILGEMLEQEIGHGRFLAVYLLSAVGGGIFSMLYELQTGQFYHSVGASDAVTGIMGAILVLIILNRGHFGHISFGRMILALVYIMYSGMQSDVVNNAAHVGGFVAGFFTMTALFFIRNYRQRQ